MRPINKENGQSTTDKQKEERDRKEKKRTTTKRDKKAERVYVGEGGGMERKWREEKAIRK